MDDELAIPSHLEITVKAVTRLQDQWSTNQVLVAGLADLEAFVRTAPDESPFIDAGPLEDFPLTKAVVTTFEHLANGTNGRISYGAAALERLGYIIQAIKGLEAQAQQLASRVAELEQRPT